MVISYEMTTSVRFCLLYGPLKSHFIAFKMSIISIIKRIVDIDVVRAKKLLHVWSYEFYDITLISEQQQRHMINRFMTSNLT